MRCKRLWILTAICLTALSPSRAADTAAARRTRATVTDDGVFVQQGHKRPHALFLIRHPDVLTAPLKRVRRGDPLWDFADNYDADLAKDPRQWVGSDPALTPDGRTVYFLTNLGQSMGAQGNTSFVLARGDVTTGRLSLLPQAGEFFGRPPEVFALSPDARDLLIALSAHNSAADASSSVSVVDLRAQRVTDLLARDPQHGHLANQVSGAVWSRDGRRVSVLIAWYDPMKLADDTLPLGQWEVKDARTGRTLSLRSRRAGPSR